MIVVTKILHGKSASTPSSREWRLWRAFECLSTGSKIEQKSTFEKWLVNYGAAA